MSMKEIKKENTPPCQIPYRDVHHPYRFQFVIPGSGISVLEDANGVLYLSAKGGSLEDLVAGDNIEINRTEDGKVIISSVDTVTDVAAGQNVTITIDPDTGAAVINAITGGATNEHYKGVFDTAQDLIDYDTDPEVGDYGLIKHVEYTDGGETTWNGQYKYCFYINGSWTVVDQMLTFTKNLDLLQQFYSVGGSSPVIYLHEVARSGDFRDLNNVPIVATPEVTVEGTTVTASCATEGAEIWYTTDGSMPHVNGTKYTGPITVTEATTFRFVGIKNGMINSLEAVVGADFSLEAPEIEYDYHTAEVTLTNPNVDGNNDPVGEIYYTIDGTEPTNASTLYAGPFDVSTVLEMETRTVKAVVYDSGTGVYSSIVSAFYNKAKTNGANGSNAETGRLSQFWVYPEGPTSISPSSDGECYYTLDGSTPDYNSTPFTETIYFNIYGGPVTLKVIGYRPGWLPTNVRTITVGYDTPTAPTISFDADTNTVTLGATGNVTAFPAIPMKTTADNPNNGYRIYYTLDGTTPTASSTLYTGPFQISGNTTVKAVIIAYGQYSSDVATENIVITAEPVISLNYLNGQISINGPAGATIYYTLDGSDPTSESTQYTGPIEDVVQLLRREIKAIAVVGSQESGIASAAYNRVVTGQPAYEVATDLNVGKCLVGPYIPAPAFSVFYSVTAPGFDVRTLDYEPTESAVEIPYYDAGNPQVVVVKTARPDYLPAYSYTNPLGYTAPTAPEITYDDGANLVTISLAGNTASIPLQTNNNVPTMGARIYYTTDGSTPDSSTGTLWTGTPFALPEGVTVIKAVTECYGEYDSAVTTEEISGGGGVYGVRFAKNSDSPDGTRVGDMTLHASLPIQSQMRRCLLADDGTVNYYLDPDDSTLKADGTAADLTGADGQYMVEIPSFYANLIETEDYVEFSVSTEPVDGYFHYPVMYVSADEACLDRATGKLAAVVNNTANYRGGSNDDTKDSDPYLTLLGKPVSNISWQDFLDAAQLRGSGWANYMNLVHSALYFLFITEYATKNTQKAYNSDLTAEGYRQGGLGPDATEFYDWDYIGVEPFIPTGFTASLGNRTGVKDYTLQYDSDGVTKTHTSHVSSYRGVSVPIGHLAKAASGFFERATSADDVYAYFCNDPDEMSYSPAAEYDSVRIAQSVLGNVVSKLGFVHGNLFAIEGTENPVEDPTQPLTQYYCDAANVFGSDAASAIYDPDEPVSLVPLLGGGASNGSFCGFAFANCVIDPALADPLIGSRLCFIKSNE